MMQLALFIWKRLGPAPNPGSTFEQRHVALPMSSSCFRTVKPADPAQIHQAVRGKKYM